MILGRRKKILANKKIKFEDLEYYFVYMLLFRSLIYFIFIFPLCLFYFSQSIYDCTKIKLKDCGRSIEFAKTRIF